MKYIERKIGNKVVYGWGRHNWRYSVIDWTIGPFVTEVKK